MTQTKLKDAIVNKLEELKNKINRPKITIYDEKVRQGFTEPCFFVQFLLNTHRHLIDNRYERLNSIEIMYFSDKKDTKEDYDLMTEYLFGELKYIYTEDDSEHPIRATEDMTAEVVDDVLHVTVNYDYHLITKENGVKMKYKEQGVDILDG